MAYSALSRMFDWVLNTPLQVLYRIALRKTQDIECSFGKVEGCRSISFDVGLSKAFREVFCVQVARLTFPLRKI